MLSPAFATAHQDAASAIRNTAMALWSSLRTRNRDITTTLGISAAVHLAVLLVFGAAMYSSGNDDADIPELSVQLVTRAGPSSQEYTEAALPQPAPQPVQDVIDDPGTSSETLDAPMVASAQPAAEQVPDVSQAGP